MLREGLKKMNFYTPVKLNERLYLIREKYAPDSHGGFTMGLVIGDKRAALIDSGMGVSSNLREIVEGLTDKPIICILTHGHPDHAGAAALFDEVYMNSADEVLLPIALSPERRLGDATHGAMGNQDIIDFINANYVDCSNFKYIDYNEETSFDLGGIKLEAFAVPGHTQGSMALLDKDNNYAFIGDAVNIRTALVNLPNEKRVGLEAYRDGLSRFVREINSDTNLYTGHSIEAMEHSIIEDMLLAVTQVLNGDTENDKASNSPFSKRPQAASKRMMEHTTGKVILVYDANLL